MEDYKKIALELGQTLISKAPETREDVERMLPELKEGDDERLRKSLSTYFAKFKPNDMWDAYFSFGDIVAWLEKQREPIDKIVERARTEKQRVLVTESDGVANIDWDTRSLQDVKLLLEYGLDYIKKLEKQGEQNLVKIPKFKNGDIIEFNGFGRNKYIIKEVCGTSHYINSNGGRMDMSYTDANFELVEPKPAWSEEDELRLNTICELLGGLDCQQNWLKSLKGRVQPQPKKEWDEDTQQWIEAIIKDYEGWYDDDKDHRDTIQIKINILKSLRPQNRWKPTEEHLKGLRRGIKNTEEGSDAWRDLKDLYEQLKAL